MGKIEEVLKWGQLSYHSSQTKAGTTIRIDQFDENSIGIFVHCQTTLIATWRGLFPGTLEFSKNRAIVLSLNKPFPEKKLTYCIEAALAYKLKNKY